MEVKKIFSISLLQVVVFIKFGTTKEDAKIVEGCVGSQLTLTCNDTKVINISSVDIGDSGSYTSPCTGTNCCPKPNDRTTKPNATHVNEVHIRCNGQPSCTVNVIRESNSWFSAYNDFERITYNCIDNGSLTTATFNTAPRTEATSNRLTFGISIKPDSSDKTKFMTTTKIWPFDDATSSGESKPLKDAGQSGHTQTIIAIICVLLFIIVVVVVIIVIVKRRRTSIKTKSEVEMTDVRNGQNGLYANQNQDTCGNPNTSSESRQSTTYEDPNNVVEYSVIRQETSPAAEGAGVEYCSIDIIKSDHQASATKKEDDGYSLAGDPDRQSTCVENFYEDVESKQSDSKAKSANIRCNEGGYEEAMNIGVQAESSGQSKLQQERRPYSKDEKSVSNSKTDEGVYKNIGEVGATPSSPSSPYEPMTPTPSQNVYANESAVPFRTESLASSQGSGSEAHTPYCEMRSPSVKLKDDGAHMLVDNDLYNH